MPSVAEHLCYNQSFHNEQLSFWNDKENHFYLLFFWIYTPSPHKIQILKDLAEEVFSIRHYIKTLCQNAADKILKTPYECYDIFILVWEVCFQNLITSIKGINMTGQLSKSNAKKYKHHRMSNKENHQLEMENY